MRACAKFDWRRGFRFTTYATWWVRQSMQRFSANQSRTIRIPVHMQDRVRRVLRAHYGFLQHHGRAPIPQELAEQTALPPAEVARALSLGIRTVSLDTPVGEDKEASLGDLIEDEQAVSPLKVAEISGLRQVCAQALGELSPREEKILRMRFGIGEAGEHTLEEIGIVFGVTRERIRQIEAKALRKLSRSSRGRHLCGFLEGADN